MNHGGPEHGETGERRRFGQRGQVKVVAVAGWGFDFVKDRRRVGRDRERVLMKTTQLIFGLWFAAGAGALFGAASQDVKISKPPRGDSPSLSSEGRTPPPVGPQVDSSRRGYVDDTVEILGVTEQAPDAEGKRKVTVRVRYLLIHYKDATLTLAFNVKSATEFFRVSEQRVQKGSEEVELSAVITPVKWPDKRPFKVQVGLLAEPRPRKWSLLAAVSQVMKPAAPLASPGGEGK